LGFANMFTTSSSIVLVVLALAACGRSEPSGVLDHSDAAKALENRNWMDLWPTSDREPLHVYRFTPAMGGGVYQDRTLFAGQFELFTYEIGKGVVKIHWPHTDDREDLKFRIERVSGPEPFDLKLTLEKPLHGPSILFGRSSETSASLRIER